VKVKGEGFFISVLRKTDNQHESSIHRKKTFDHSPGKFTERLSSWFKNSEEAEFIKRDDLIIALPKGYLFEIEFLSKFLKVIQKGTAIATSKHDKLIPEHAFALSTKINRDHFNSIELSTDEAIAYLRKDVLNLQREKAGFTLMNFQGVSIGWANLLGNRMNNLYPSAWRIRSDYDPSLEG
jgi:NOL1/NOP2/fmu family ribosome biogenesis protein